MQQGMETSEAIEAVRRRQRVGGPHSLHAAALPVEQMLKVCPGFNHQWRTLFCDGDTDVVECYRCGIQDLARCNFDDEYA